MLRRKPLFFLVTALALLGCDSKAPSKSNFKAALQHWYDENPRCASWTSHLPEEVATKPTFNQSTLARYQILQDAGLVTSASSVKTTPGMFGGPPTTENIVTYSQGGPNASAWHAGTGFFAGQEICYGKVHVDSIDNFTEPADAFGQRVSQISYTYKVEDIPDWAKKDSLQTVLPALKTDLQQTTQHGTDVLTLTNNGWSKNLR